MAFNAGKCCRSLPTGVSKHTTSLAGRAPAPLALGLTGAEVARAVRLCKDDAAKCCAWATLNQQSCTGADTSWGAEHGLYRGEARSLFSWGVGASVPDLLVISLTDKPYLEHYPIWEEKELPTDITSHGQGESSGSTGCLHHKTKS